MNHFCRHCGSPLEHEVIDLGHQPPSNAYLTKEQLSQPEPTYPLKVFVCTNCWLVQLPAHASAEQLFTPDYAYFSSTSSSWCAHAKSFVDEAINRLSLGSSSFVVELASNDGYLLQYMKANNIPCLGIEPTHATARVARDKGIETIEEFFGEQLSETLDKADLIVANNVLAHVPDINDFVSGIRKLLKPRGQASIEFPHLLNLLKKNQFDTIYHEHYSYLSLSSVQRIACHAGLDVIDVQNISTHGGSLRIWLSHKNAFAQSSSVKNCLEEEHSFGIETLAIYGDFQSRAAIVKYKFLDFLLRTQSNHTRSVLGYGAAAKGNTLLNYAGISADLLPAVADRAVSKQGKFLPGSHIPIISPEQLVELDPTDIIVFPWNIISEICTQYPNRKLVTFIPEFKTYL